MNEPVAWMYQIHDITGWTWVIDQRLPDYEYRNEKPLYTHPAKTLTEDTECQYCKQGCIRCDARKLLTDEEIKDFIYPQFVFEDGGIGMPLDEFLATVRAILRKAQEK